MLSGDSGEYEFLTEAVQLSAHIDAPTVEIGVRAGLGSATIMDAIVEYCPGKTHIGIDPYGSLLYAMKETVDPCRLDYTNDMYKQCMADLFNHIIGKPVDFIHFKMTDREWISRFISNLFFTYDLNGKQITGFSMVHFDGPHTAEDVMYEVEAFNAITPSGATFVFDDVSETDFFYTHKTVHDWLLNNGWEHIKTGVKKALYRKR